MVCSMWDCVLFRICARPVANSDLDEDTYFYEIIQRI